MSTEIETDDRLTTQIAVMALVYRNLKQTGHNLVEDFENGPGQVSLLLMLSDEFLSTTDWDVIRALQFPNLQDRLTALYAALLELDERRAEALLHAWPTREVRLPLVPEVAHAHRSGGEGGQARLAVLAQWPGKDLRPARARVQRPVKLRGLAGAVQLASD